MLKLILPLALALAPQQPRVVLAPKRPRDPWVFRSVLDLHPRMVTIALTDEMWASYDASTCGLYKAWKGGVKFDGPVYTTVHGPQPTTQGTTYTEGIPGDVWEANVDGKDVAALALWRGYRMNEGHVVLQYEIVIEDGRKLRVDESPEFVRPEVLFDDEKLEEYVLFKGQPGLLRSFLAHDVPDGVKISLQLRTDGVTGKLGETLEHERFVDVPDEKGEKKTRVYSHLALTKARPSSNLVLFFEPIAEASTK